MRAPLHSTHLARASSPLNILLPLPFPATTHTVRALIASCGSVLKVVSVETGEVLHTLVGHTDEVTGVCMNPKNQLQVLSSSLDGTGKCRRASATENKFAASA